MQITSIIRHSHTLVQRSSDTAHILHVSTDMHNAPGVMDPGPSVLAALPHGPFEMAVESASYVPPLICSVLPTR